MSPPKGCSPDRPSYRDNGEQTIGGVQFTLTGTGRDIAPTQTTFEITRNGKTQKLRSNVDICLTPQYARSRGLDVGKLRSQGLLWEKPVKRKNTTPPGTARR